MRRLFVILMIISAVAEAQETGCCDGSDYGGTSNRHTGITTSSQCTTTCQWPSYVAEWDSGSNTCWCWKGSEVPTAVVVTSGCATRQCLCKTTQCLHAILCTRPADTSGYAIASETLDVPSFVVAFTSNACAAGYSGTPSAIACSTTGEYTLSGCDEVDECTAGTSNCHARAECSNTPGSFTCTCTSEFEGDGVNACDYVACSFLHLDDETHARVIFGKDFNDSPRITRSGVNGLDVAGPATLELRLNGVRILTQGNRRLDQTDPGFLLAELAKVEDKAKEIESLLKEIESL